MRFTRLMRLFPSSMPRRPGCVELMEQKMAARAAASRSPSSSPLLPLPKLLPSRPAQLLSQRHHCCRYCRGCCHRHCRHRCRHCSRGGGCWGPGSLRGRRIRCAGECIVVMARELQQPPWKPRQMDLRHAHCRFGSEASVVPIIYLILCPSDLIRGKAPLSRAVEQAISHRPASLPPIALFFNFIFISPRSPFTSVASISIVSQ